MCKLTVNCGPARNVCGEHERIGVGSCAGDEVQDVRIGGIIDLFLPIIW
jgi:hypothetical protein